MRKRTRVVACIYLALSLYVFIGVLFLSATSALVNVPVSTDVLFTGKNGSLSGTRPVNWWMWLGILLAGLQWTFWWAWLKQKAWAWKVLVAVFLVYVLERAWRLAASPAYYAAHPEFERPVVAFGLTLLWALVGVVLPLWALLTDRPSRWIASE